MRTITLEEHFMTPRLLQAARRGGGASEAIGRAAEQLADLGDRRIADMDAGGVDLQVLSMPNTALSHMPAQAGNDAAREANETAHAAVLARPDRLAAFACLNMTDPDAAADELRRCVTQMGFLGTLIAGTTQGQFLDDPRFDPVLAAAQELDVPIYLHPGPPPAPVQEAYFENLPNAAYSQMLATAAWGWHVETGLHVLRLIVGGVFQRYPRLQMIVGHMGEDLPFSLARAESILSRNPEPLPQTVTQQFLEHFTVTCSGYFTLPPLLTALQVLGAERLMYSIDYPFSQNTDGVALLGQWPASAEDKERFAHGNAERVLKLKA